MLIAQSQIYLIDMRMHMHIFYYRHHHSTDRHDIPPK